MISLSRSILSLLALLFCALSAQSANIKGNLRSGDKPVEFASVTLMPGNKGVVATIEGAFLIENVDPGTYTLSISAVGFKKNTQKLTITNDDLDLGTISLVEDLLGLSEVVITGTMKETYVTNSPVKVEVVTAKFLEQTTSPTNIVESISLINGVQEVVACGVCYTNSISINGLPGPYTTVLMDGTPMFGNLASVYGLNGIPRQMIERFEVIKGPNSTLYGSEAMAGVINIITKDPSNEPLLSVDLMGTSHMESFGNIALAPKTKFANGFVGLNYAYLNNFDDFNGDGFGDGLGLDRLSAFTKWNFKRKQQRQFSVSAKWYYEDRRNGVEAFFKNRAYKDLRGSADIYGESIYTNRFEVFGRYEFAYGENFNLDYSFSNHEQDSYYGDQYYEAKQTLGFLNLTKFYEKGGHQILSGATFRAQFYDDNTVATATQEGGASVNQPEEQFIPGLFVQDEWMLHHKFTTLAGMRVDHYGLHGPILSPRLSVKYKPSDGTNIRANYGTGFRVVNLFTEDHAFVTGQREVIVADDIRPERSQNLSLTLSQFLMIQNSQGNIDFDMFYTHFTNKIIPDYETPGFISYANSEGTARSRGVSLSWNHALVNGLRWTLGTTVQEAYERELVNGKVERTPVQYTSKWSGNAVLNYRVKALKLDLAYTGTFNGPMHLPLVYDLDENGVPQEIARPTLSQPFAIHNFQVSRNFSNQKGRLYGGIQNFLNYRQPISPLVGFNDPNYQQGFSPYFDTAYAYSTLHGAEVYIGFVYNFK